MTNLCNLKDEEGNLINDQLPRKMSKSLENMPVCNTLEPGNQKADLNNTTFEDNPIFETKQSKKKKKLMEKKNKKKVNKDTCQRDIISSNPPMSLSNQKNEVIESETLILKPSQLSPHKSSCNDVLLNSIKTGSNDYTEGTQRLMSENIDEHSKDLQEQQQKCVEDILGDVTNNKPSEKEDKQLQQEIINNKDNTKCTKNAYNTEENIQNQANNTQNLKESNLKANVTKKGKNNKNNDVLEGLEFKNTSSNHDIYNDVSMNTTMTAPSTILNESTKLNDPKNPNNTTKKLDTNFPNNTGTTTTNTNNSF